MSRQEAIDSRVDSNPSGDPHRRLRGLAAGALGLGLAAATLVGAARPVLAAAKDVDLNADGTNESPVSLTVVTSTPVKIQNKITNRAVGQAFRFSWPSAGPGGFSSSLASGTTAGVGSIWTWQTLQQVFSFTGSTCTNDICFTRVSDSRQRGPFGVPGRSLTSSSVTVSNASLTSSLITFFSPEEKLFSVTSIVDEIGPGLFRYTNRTDNFTSQPIVVNHAASPLGCDSFCGNNLREGIEVCDGSDLAGATCGTYGEQGTLGCSFDCASYDTKGCSPFPCGNGVREGSEVCDGTDLGGTTCTDLGGTGGSLHCGLDCSAYDVGDCDGLCGNGVREGTESCDGSDFGGQTCESEGGSEGFLTCTQGCAIDLANCSNVCGNGIRDGKEACDGNDLDSLSCEGHGGGGSVACSPDCAADYSNCTANYCGNGSVDTPYEECDGTDLGGQSCTTIGGTGGSLGCQGSCLFDTTECTGYCGNGSREGSEECDTGDFGGFTCEDFGGSGALACTGECAFDTAGCFPTGSFPCDAPARTETIPGNSSNETCDFDSHPAKEIPGKVKACGALIPGGDLTCESSTDPATEGTASVLVPDPDVTVGNVFFTSPGIQVLDADADGLPQPGEIVHLLVPLLNVGRSRVTGVIAQLVSAPRDLDGDGIQDTVAIPVDTSAYPDGSCFDGQTTATIGCHDPIPARAACTNLVPFEVAVPAGHPEDVSRKFELHVTYTPTAREGLTTFSMPFVLGVGGVSVCGNGIVEGLEDCDDGNTTGGDCCSSMCRLEPAGSPCASDGNPCTTDACNGSVPACEHTPNTNPCDDGNPCTSGDVCAAGTCRGANTTDPCSDGNACTVGDVCGGGTCHPGPALDCNDGNTCTNDSCSPAGGCVHALNGTCGSNPRGYGYWKRLCNGPHPSGEFYTLVDVDCVNDACPFSGVASVDDMCDRLFPDPPSDKCEKAEAHFMTLLLNVCRGRILDTQTIHSGCSGATTVGEARAQVAAALCSPARTPSTCQDAQCTSDDVSSGHALGVTNLSVQRMSARAMKLTWGPPYTAPDQEAPTRYSIWRRTSSESAFVKLADTTALSWSDSAATGAFYEYEVTVIW